MSELVRTAGKAFCKAVATVLVAPLVTVLPIPFSRPLSPYWRFMAWLWGIHYYYGSFGWREIAIQVRSEALGETP